MNHSELRFIRRALEAQGFRIWRTERGFWVIRNHRGTIATFLLPEADELDWHNALLGLKERGLLIWPPDW